MFTCLLRRRIAMEECILDKQQDCQHKQAIPPCLKGADDENVSKGKTLTIICETCTNIQNQAFNQCQSCNGFGDIYLDEDMTEHSHRFMDVSKPQILSIVYTGSPCLPGKVKASRLLNRNLKLRKETRIAVMDNNFMIQYASALRGPKIIISPIGKWISDSQTDKAAKLFRGPVYIHRADQASSSSSERASSVDNRDINLMESPGPSSALCCVSPENHREEATCDGNWSSQLNLTDKMFISSPSTRSLCSFSSRLSGYGPISKGLLHCISRNGVCYFVFLMAENPVEVFIASQLNASTSDDKALDYMYSFQCMPIKGHTTSRSNIIGMMEVSSCVTFSDSGSRITESEFVLYGVSGDSPSDAKSSISKSFKSKILSKHMTNMFKSRHLNLKKTITRSSEIDLDFENFLHKPRANDLNHMQSALQLAAVVIKEYQNNSGKGRTGGGWGLKFLEKISYSNSPFDLSSLDNCQGVAEESVRNINVLVPAGIHGEGTVGHGGPSSLVERWRTGGHCDCGGWDMGCPLTVLKNQSGCRVGFSEGMSVRDCSVDLFVEGAKQGEPVVRVVTLQEDLHAVYFQSNLSPLQGFSIGVAILHAEVEALCRKL